jgi:hypothetical protein
LKRIDNRPSLSQQVKVRWRSETQYQNGMNPDEISALVHLAFLFGCLVGMFVSLAVVGVVALIQLEGCFSRMEKKLKGPHEVPHA